MQKPTRWLLPCAVAWACAACGGADSEPPPLMAPPVSSTAPTAQAAPPIEFRACCDSGSAQSPTK